MTEKSSSVLMAEPIRAKLRLLRPPLLRLHKALLDYERAAFEQAQGRSVTPGELVRLAMFDPWFQWLRRISEMIVRMDTFEDDPDAAVEDGVAVYEEARLLFRPGAEPGELGASEFQERYKNALQKDPGSVLAHVDVQRALFTDS